MIAYFSYRIYNELKTTPNFSVHTSLSKHGTPSMSDVPITVKQNNEKNRNRDLALSKTAQPLSLSLERLNQSIDLRVDHIETLFYNSEYKKCLNLLDK